MRPKDAAQVENIMHQHRQHAEEAMLKLEASNADRFMNDLVGNNDCEIK